jgi:hypothetical protein
MYICHEWESEDHISTLLAKQLSAKAKSWRNGDDSHLLLRNIKSRPTLATFSGNLRLETHILLAGASGKTSLRLLDGTKERIEIGAHLGQLT